MSSAKCPDDRDRIFALNSLDGRTTRVNYTEATEAIFARFAIKAMAKRRSLECWKRQSGPVCCVAETENCDRGVACIIHGNDHQTTLDENIFHDHTSSCERYTSRINFIVAGYDTSSHAAE
jgi:hypothetical protein